MNKNGQYGHLTNTKKQNIICQLLLLSATIVWGTSFTVLQDTISEIPRFYVIAIRMFVSAIVLFCIFFKRIIKMDKETFLCGLLLGAILACAYITQTLGLEHTTAGKNAFLTSMYCILTPFLMWLLFGKKPKIYNLVAVGLCVIGIGLVVFAGSDNGGKSELLGDGLTIFSALFFGLQVVFIAHFANKGLDSVLILFMEISVCGVIMALLSLCVELPQGGIQVYSLKSEHVWKIAYLAFVCTLYPQFAQIMGQRHTSPSQASIILSLEAVFGVIFSIIFGREKISVMLIMGFVVIFGSIMVSELKPDFKAILTKMLKRGKK